MISFMRYPVLSLLPALCLIPACAPAPPPQTSPRSTPARRPAAPADPALAPARDLGSVGTLTSPGRRQSAEGRTTARTTSTVSAGQPGKPGRVLDIRPYKKRQKKRLAIRYDLRAHLVIPVNVIRIYSDEHKADEVASKAYIKTQIQVMNQLFTLPAKDLRRYGVGKPAPMVQFQLNKIYTVHERLVSKVLGFPMDTENLMMQGKTRNGQRVANTWDLRSVKVKGETSYLTLYYAYRGRSGHRVGRWGGVSNLGFAAMSRPSSAGVLTQVSGRRAYMGPILFRVASPSTMAHEVGHYFDLPHAWKRMSNRTRQITDLGTGPQNNVDLLAGVDNVMDYGRAGKQYFSRHQLRHMYRYALKKAPELITVFKTRGGPAPRPGPRGTPQPRIPGVASRPTTGTMDRVWVDRLHPAGPVTVHARFSVRHGKGAGRVVVWLTDGSGQALQDADGRYRTRAGQVAMGKDYSARGKLTKIRDLKLTLPAGQLHLPPGRHRVRAVVALFSGGRYLAKKHVDFTYRVPERPRRPAAVKRIGAWIRRVQVTPNVAVAGSPQVRLAVDLTTDNLKGQPVALQARFYFPDGRVLKDFDRRYRSAEGHAMVSRRLVPKYRRSKWSSLALRMPVSELHLHRGKRVTLTAAVTVMVAGRVLASKVTPRFTVNTGTPTTAPTPARPARASTRAVIKRVWVTHRVKRRGQLGLFVKARLELRGFKGQRLLYSARFSDRQGRPLRDKDRRYANPNRQVAASLSVTPRYDSAVFPSATLFLPYAQLHLGPGQHTVQVVVGLSKGGRRIGTQSKPLRFTVNPRRPPPVDPWAW